MPTPINGTTGNDTLLGTAGNDSIVGLAGDDRIYGSGGSDTIDGDTGSDSVDYSNELDGINANLTNGIATRYASTDSLFNIEHLYGGKGNDELTGDSGNNFLAGNQGADDISGGGGNDTISGGSGNDSLRGQDGDDTVLGGSGDDYVGGGDGNDRLEGGPGNDYLNGASGADTMIGGDGDDEYDIDDSGDVVVESNPDSVFGSGGIDQVHVGVRGISSYTLPDNIENALVGSVVTGLFGNSLDNLFLMNNRLGSLTLDGQGGSDWVSYLYSDQPVTVDLNLAGPQTTGYGIDTLVSIENLSGSDFNDSLSGDDNNNSLEGRDGNDTLLGLGGDDILIENGQSGSDDYIDGGSGDDTLAYDIAAGTVGVTVNLNLSSPQNTGAGSDTILNVEHLYGGKGDDNFTGNSGANTLTGSSGNDTLRGEGGNDTLLGGSGNDLLAGGAGDNRLEGGAGNDYLYAADGNNTFIGGDGDDSYEVSSSGDVVIESNADSISGGVDEVSVEYVASYTLPDNVENAEAGTGVDLLTGNSLNNLFVADSGTITLDGGAGSDRVSYLNSVYFGQGVSIDLNIAGPQATPRSTQTLVSIENLSGSNYNDSLTGDDNNNALEGRDGNDTLKGMDGNDTLTGGAGSDRFVFSSPPNALSNLDTITDFTTLVDKIVLADAIFTSLTTKGVLPSNNLHAGPGAVAAVETDDFLIFNTSTGVLYYDEDASNNNASPIQIAVLQGVASLAASDIEVASDNRSVTLTSGSDSLIAGSGNDTVSGLQGEDTIYGGDGDDSLSGDGGYDLLYGENGNDTLIGGSRGDVLEGGDGNDSLVGGIDSDWLYGDAGIDTMVGGEGDDIYFVDDAADVVEETEADRNAGGYDVIRSTAPTYTLPANVEAAVIATDGTAGIIGNELDNNIEANTGDNYIDGMGGFNTVSYHEASGPVTVNLSITVPQDTGGAGTDTLLNIDAISGSDYNDVLTGNSNDNWLDGHYGDDTLTGGDGDDGFVVHSDYTLIIEENADSDTGGYDTIYSNIGSYTLPDNIENGYIWNLFKADLTGNSLDNRLHAGEGDNIIDGGEGDDWVSYDQVDAGYYSGDEYYYYSGYGVRVDLANPESQYTYESGWDTLISIENVIGSYGNDDLSGNDDDNALVGLRGSDRLFGNAGDDTLVGGEESDFLDGGAGDDYLDGGDHTDTASYENSLGAVVVDLAFNSPQNTGTSGTDTLVNIENIIGSAFADQLTGNSAANELTGGEGNDSLSGGGGNDILDGGLGSDRFLFNSVLDWDLNVDYVYNFELNADKIELDRTVFAALTVTGTLSADNFISGYGVTAAADDNDFIIFDTNDGSIYYDADGNGLTAEPVLFAILSGEGGLLLTASDFEVVNPTVLNGTSEDDLLVTGEGNQVINGLEGQDSLDGGAGDDTMTGGDGSDSYHVRESGDDVIETNGDPQIGGYDNVNSYLASYTLPANVENGFIRLETAASITGNSLPNYLGAGKGDNTIDGGASNDVVSYHDATTEGVGVTVSLAIDGPQATGGSGTDTLISIEGLGGTQYNDSLTGNSGNNSLDGNAGDDTISGGAGDDHISEYIGDDLIDGGDGTDSLSYYSDADGITVDLNVTGPQNTGGAGTDTITNIEHLFGSKSGDHFTGTAGHNNLYGYGGDDTLTGGAGNDMLEGGDGIDTASYADAPAGVTVNLAITNYQNTEAAGFDQLRDIEILEGSNFADKLSGDNNDNRLYGGDGDDTLNGGIGNDNLQGGMGADTFVFNTLPDIELNIDHLGDFTTGSDKIVLDGTIFTALPLGTVTSSNFRIGTTALDADDFLLFSVNDDNRLFYDADGSGPISPILIATMSGSRFVAATDIDVSAGNTLTGTANNDTLIGTSANDVINGLQGNDYIEGGAGIDTMSGGDGSDNYEVRDAGDLVIETNNDAATGGYDGVNSHLASYILPTNVENGFIRLETAASIIGNSLNNYLGAGRGDNTIDGGSGNDYASFFGATTGSTGVTVSLAVGGPQATGGSGTDTLINIENLGGTAYNDVLTGNSSNNTLDGNAGDDTLSAGDGDDHISESTGDDIIDGGAGSDSLDYYSDADGITVDLNITGPQSTGGAGTDTITNIEHLFGGKGDDNFTGNSGNNNLYGYEGDDTLTGGAGNDMLEGGSGMDTASYANALEAVTVSLAITTYQYTGGAGSDQLRDIEVLRGSNFDDNLSGDNNANSLVGGSGADTLNGGLGNDTFEGGAGADTFVFNTVPASETITDYIRDFTSGSDKILLDSAVFAALPIGTLNADNFHIGSVAQDPTDYLVYDNGHLYYDADGSGPAAPKKIVGLEEGPTLAATDIEVSASPPINGTTGNDSLIGTDGYDVINGLEGHDFIDGGAGIDTMTGGDGNDNYQVRDVGDLVIEVSSDSFVGGFDFVSSHLVSYTLPANVESGRIVLDTAANLTGNSLNNFIRAGKGDNIIDGSGGVDGVDYFSAVNGSTGVTINLSQTGAQNTGGSGSDTLISIENVFGTNFADALSGNAGNNQLNGYDGNDTLIGGDGDDVLSETTGDDSINGGAGSDTLSYFGTTAALTINLNVTTAQNTGAGSDTIVDVENLSGGNANDVLLGNAQNNSLGGNAGNDTLDGAAGHDLLDGGTGADSMSGGDGNDNYFVDDIADIVVEGDSSTSGFDSVNTSLATYTLGVNIENGFIMHTGAASLTGNSLDNVLGAGKGDNIIDGGAGNDTVSYLNAVNNATGVSVSLAVSGPIATGGSGTDTLLNIENLQGSSYDDLLTGNSFNNRLEGFAGNDTLFGGDGDDILVDTAGDNFLDGGNGSDGLSFTSVTTALTINLETTTPQAIGIGTSTILNVEHLSGGQGNDFFTGTAATNILRGNAGNDSLFGGDGVDLLDGGAGIDSMVGGNGDDTYRVDNVGDTVFESEADSKTGGFDLVGSTLASYELGNHIEAGAIQTTGTAGMTGNSLDNTIYAGRGNNAINGADGTDTVNYVNATTGSTGVTVSLAITTAQTTGGSGDDTLLSIEHLIGSHNNDVLTGNELPNRLDGSHGNDSVNGGDGDDTLVGGNGNDTLIGGAGVDRFQFSSALDEASNVDLISDFLPGTDKIVLSSQIFAAFSASGALTSANFRSGSGATTAQDADDFLIHNWINNIIYYDADGSGSAHSPIPFARLPDNDYSTITINDFELFSSAGVVVGSTGGDSIVGGSGPDLLDGGDGDDEINGGEGDDILVGGTGNDVVIGGPGIDTASYSSATSNAVAELRRGKASDGQGGNDTLASIENLQGGPQNDILVGDDFSNFFRGEGGDDILYGNGGNDSLLGGDGADLLRGGAGSNFIDGGPGIDTVDYSAEPENIDVRLGAGIADLVDGATDVLVNIENVIGGYSIDYIEGNALANRLEGGAGDDDLVGLAGDDSLIGGSGNDLLFGGLGLDVLVGGRGSDAFIFNTTPNSSNIDQILDFDTAVDSLVFDTVAFTGGGWGAGKIDAEYFVAAPNISSAVASSNFLLGYNTASGVLYYDADGSGTLYAPEPIVTLIGAPTLTAGPTGNLASYSSDT